MSSFCRDDDGELARVLKDEQRCLARLDRTSFWIVELSHALEVQEGSQHWLRRGVSGIALFERATAVVAAFYHALAEDQGVAPHERMLDLNLQQGWNGRVSLGMLYMLWCCLRRRMSSRACKLGGSKHAAITQLIEQVDPDLKDSDGLTPLHIVAQELHMLGDAFPEMIARTWLERSTRRYALLGDALRTCVAHINDMDEEGCSEDKVTAWTRLLLSRPHQDLNTPTSVLHALVDCTQPPYATICGLVQLGRIDVLALDDSYRTASNLIDELIATNDGTIFKSARQTAEFLRGREAWQRAHHPVFVHALLEKHTPLPTVLCQLVCKHLYWD
jgi:hypothetical protein